MTKKGVFIILIIGLLLINFILIGLLISKPEVSNTLETQEHHSPKMVIIERLGFDDGQLKQYVELIDAHGVATKEKDAKIAQIKAELYQLLAGNLMYKKADSLTSEIGKIQKEIELLHFNHFKDIKALCNEKQLIEFEKLAKDLATVFGKTTE